MFKGSLVFCRYHFIFKGESEVEPLIVLFVIHENSKCAKGQYISKAIYGPSILQKNDQNSLVLSIFFTQDSEFHSFFGRIEDT